MILRSMLLSSVRPFYAPDTEGKTAAQLEREKIVVTSSKKPEQPEPEKDDKKEDETDDDKEDDKESEETGEDDNKEGDEEDKDKEDDKEEVSQEDKDKQIAKLTKTIERLQKRVGRTTGEKAAIAAELQKAKTQLEAKVVEGEGLTEEEVERRAEIKAVEKSANREFNNAVQKLVKAAGKIDGKIDEKLTELAADVAPIPGTMIAILEDLDNDNGGAVLAHLANNVDEYEEIWDLPVARLSNRLNKISDKLAEAAKEKPKQISKVPPPLKGIRGSQESPTVLSDKPNKDSDSMAKFIKQRAIQVEQRRKAKLGL